MRDKCRSSSVISNVFLLAGAYNIICVVVFSKFFTDTLLSSLYPTVFSPFNLVFIMLWGVAYSSVAKSYRSVPHLLLVFATVKLIYFLTWIAWHYHHGISGLLEVFSQSPLTALAYATYGPCDAAFGTFFLWVALKGLLKPSV